MTYFDQIESPIGQLLVTSDGEALTGLYLENHKRGPTISSSWTRDSSRFADVKEVLRGYFAGERKSFDVPLRMEGTDFQTAVWAELQAIPIGETVTYGSIAKKLGLPKASRAVGAAVGANPISIIVPCHRVVGSTGSITGYAGGIERKRALLDLEQRRLF